MLKEGEIEGWMLHSLDIGGHKKIDLGQKVIHHYFSTTGPKLAKFYSLLKFGL